MISYTMLKQPKYFVKSAKDVHTSTPPQAATPTQTSTTAEVHSAVPAALASLGQAPRRIPGVILGVGLTTLFALSGLVAFNTGILKASAFRGNLPVIFNRSAPINTIVADSKSGIGQGINFDIQTADARIEIIRAFLERYKSPLTPYDHYASALVTASDRYGLDYRLLPAIMMQESNLCKSSDPKLHNCLGFGIHERGTLGFDTYEDGFDRAARELKANYIDRGLVTPEQIMKKYTPSSNGSWANSVNQWIAEMEHNDREIGKTASSDANLLEYTANK